MEDELTVQTGFGVFTAPDRSLDLPLTPSRSSATVRLGVAYLAVALLLRGPTLGIPTLHIDEQFYLLVGDRLLDGTLPYVDIWDRKPIGLFALYAAIRALGGDGIVQYQVAAMLSATATALTVNRIARNIATAAGAWWAGVAYLLYLSAFDCFGGQSPVFYNLLVALAAWAMCGIVTGPPAQPGGRTPPSLITRGAGVMALIGLAIQIKYTVLFEGGVFGLALLGRARADGFAPARMAVAAATWIAVALAPTALALGIYAYLGHGQAFYFANFQSIFSRQEPQDAALRRLVNEIAVLIPFWLAIFHAVRGQARLADERALENIDVGLNPAAHGFLRLWGIAGVAGFLIFGTWYDHYVGPLVGPLAVLAAPMLGRAGKLRFYTQLLIGFGVFAAGYMTIYETTHHGTRAQIARLTELIRSNVGNGCAYLNEGDPILYLTTHSCLATRYIFPNHLAGMVDVNSLGVNVDQEVTRIMASHPSVVMIATKPTSKPVNHQSRAIVLKALARDYTRYAIAKSGRNEYQLFRLNPRAAPGAVAQSDR